MVIMYNFTQGKQFFFVWATDTKYSEKKVFQSPFQGLLHHQNLNCSLYAEPLKQAKKNYQRFTLDNPS